MTFLFRYYCCFFLAVYVRINIICLTFSLRLACTFLGPSRKRGPPKGYIDAIESRLHQTEALVGILLALANPEKGPLGEGESCLSFLECDIRDLQFVYYCFPL